MTDRVVVAGVFLVAALAFGACSSGDSGTDLNLPNQPRSTNEQALPTPNQSLRGSPVPVDLQATAVAEGA